MEQLSLTTIFHEFLVSNINKTFTTSTIFSELHAKRPKTTKHLIQTYLAKAKSAGLIKAVGWQTMGEGRGNKQREWKVVKAPPKKKLYRRSKPPVPKHITHPETEPETKPDPIPKRPAPATEPTIPTEIDAMQLGEIFFIYIEGLRKIRNELEAKLREGGAAKNAVRGLQNENDKLRREVKDLKAELETKVTRREMREVANENEQLKKKIEQQNKELAQVKKMKSRTFTLGEIAHPPTGQQK